MKKALLKNIKTLNSLPLLSSSLKRLIEIEEDNKLSTHELSAIILDDYGLINKVLQTVNAFYYNRLGKEINTVTQAVVLLGFNSIKKIALSMAVLELLGDNGNDAAVSEIGKAFLAAHLAREIGSGQRGAEPEEIFISTLFRRLARIALAVGNPELLSEVIRLESSKDSGDRAKAKRIIRTLGYKLSEYWNLPKTIAGYLEGCASISGTSGPGHRSLARDVSTFVSMLEDGSETEDFSLLKEKIIKNYSMEPGSMEAKIREAARETIKSIPVFDKRLKSRIQDPGAGEFYHQEQETSGEQGETETQSHLEKEILFTGLVQNLMSAVNDRETGLDQIYLLAIEILRRVINIGNIVFCKVSSGGSLFSACYGMGDQAGLIKRALAFDLRNGPRELKNAFSMEKETVFHWKDLIETGNGVRTNLLSRSLLLAPLVIETRNIGCFILDKDSGDSFEAGEILKTSIIRQLVITATSLRARKRGSG